MKIKISIIITILIMIFIFMMSADDKTQSKDKSDFFVNLLINNILHNPKLHNDEAFLNLSGFIIRKTAHFTIYFTLGISMIFTVRDYLKKLSYKQKFFLSLLFCFLYASTDEIHQIFSHRGAMATDVMLDTLGSLTGLLIISLLRYIYIRIHNKKVVNQNG